MGNHRNSMTSFYLFTIFNQLIIDIMNQQDIVSELRTLIKDIEDKGISESISEKLMSLSITVTEELVKNSRYEN